VTRAGRHGENEDTVEHGGIVARNQDPGGRRGPDLQEPGEPGRVVFERGRVSSMVKTLKSLKFLVTGPLVLLMLVVINWMTSPGVWWVQWAALGIGIAWVVALLRVLRALILLGGLAALGTWLYRRYRPGGEPERIV